MPNYVISHFVDFHYTINLKRPWSHGFLKTKRLVSDQPLHKIICDRLKLISVSIKLDNIISKVFDSRNDLVFITNQ